MMVTGRKITPFLPPCDLFMSENIPGDPEALNPDGRSRFPQGWAGQNNSGYSNPEFDEACQGRFLWASNGSHRLQRHVELRGI